MVIDEIRNIFDNKRCVILGFGREGKCWLELLKNAGCCAEIAVADMNPQNIPGVTGIYGEDYLKRAGEYDIILQSPGVVIKDSYDERTKAKILTQTELLLRLKPCRIIGITGTKGKSTTSSLIHHFLTACGYNSMLIGNIGVPPLARLSEMNENTVAVCEMGCHQLEFVHHSPDIALLLNIFPEHLDHYVSFDAYSEAKRNIVRFQKENDIGVVNKELLPVEGKGSIFTSEYVTDGSTSDADVHTDGRSIYLFGREIPASDIHTRLRGKHNLYNIAMALAASVKFGADADKCLASLPDFAGLEHRLEFVAEINGVEYINDSISTIPEAAIAAVNAFDKVDCLILGGMDRGISYDKLGAFLSGGAVENVILLPDSGKRIGELISNAQVHLLYADDMEQAVALAKRYAKKRVLLSPAAASYGFYKNFEERGRHFKALVNE